MGLMTAQQYMDAAMGLFKTGQPDAAILKSILVKDQAAKVDQGEGPLFDIGKGPFAKMLTLVQASYTMGEGEIGLSEATVHATLTVQAMGRSLPMPVKIALVREGLAWKVDGRQCEIAAPQLGGAAPQL